jgi:hypothetical protein
MGHPPVAWCGCDCGAPALPRGARSGTAEGGRAWRGRPRRTGPAARRASEMPLDNRLSRRTEAKVSSDGRQSQAGYAAGSRPSERRWRTRCYLGAPGERSEGTRGAGGPRRKLQAHPALFRNRALIELHIGGPPGEIARLGFHPARLAGTRRRTTFGSRRTRLRRIRLRRIRRLRQECCPGMAWPPPAPYPHIRRLPSPPLPAQSRAANPL